MIYKNKSVSLKAKGLYFIMQSEGIESKERIKEITGVGEKAFNSAWKELKEKGYLRQEKIRGDNGKFYYRYELINFGANRIYLE